MADDEAKARYFGGLSIFMFSMIGITLADNLIMIFVFWELVGFSSYLLIAHYFKTDEAAKASRKAFYRQSYRGLWFSSWYYFHILDFWYS